MAKMMTQSHADKSLEQALANCQEHARIAYQKAGTDLELLKKDWYENEKKIEHTLSQLDHKSAQAGDVHQKISDQFKELSREMQALYSETSRFLNQKHKDLNFFNVVLFGRTMTGKSTIMEILTQGSGASIGKGTQRTTRDVRSYQWQGLRVFDVPGIAAFNGKQDDDLAFDQAQNCDLVLFLITDDAPQAAEAECLAQLKKLGKPILCICNLKYALRDADDFEIFMATADDIFDEVRIGTILKQFSEMVMLNGVDINDVPLITIHAQSRFLAAQMGDSSDKKLLMQLSRFDDFERELIRKVKKEGVFLRSRSFLDLSAKTTYDAVHRFFKFYRGNLVSLSVFRSKSEQWQQQAAEYKKTSNDLISEKLASLQNKIKKQIPDFAESHYESKNLDTDWQKFLSGFQIEQECASMLQKLFEDFQSLAHSNMRELEAEMKFNYAFESSSGLGGFDNNDYRRWFRWTTSAAGVILGLGALVLSSGLLAVAAGAFGLLSMAASWFKSKAQKKNEACKKIEDVFSERTKVVFDKLDTDLHANFCKGIDDKVAGISGFFDHSIQQIGALANVQYQIAKKFNDRQLSINHTLIAQAVQIFHLDMKMGDIIHVARVPGSVFCLLVKRNTLISSETQAQLSSLVAEKVVVVCENYNPMDTISRVLTMDSIDVSVEVLINSDQKVATVSIQNAEKIVYPTIHDRVALAQQLTGLYILVAEGTESHE